MTEFLPTARVFPNPEQPRKDFPADHIRGLASSFKARVAEGLNPLLQPITVRTVDGGYEIVAGECRWRGHVEAGLETIEANVVNVSERRRDIDAIVENLQRRDVHPLEEARAYQRMLDKGCTIEDLAQEVGTTETRITERVALLNMRPEYQQLFQSGHLDRNSARELASLPAHAQGALFDLIRKGEFANKSGQQCSGSTRLRAVAESMRHTLAQGSMFELPEPPTAEEKAAVSRLESMIDKLTAMLNQGFDDGDLVAAAKVDPGKAVVYADKLALIARHVAMMENSLRTSTVVAQSHLSLFDVAA